MEKVKNIMNIMNQILMVNFYILIISEENNMLMENYFMKVYIIQKYLMGKYSMRMK